MKSSKSKETSSFQDRFKGKTSTMDKQGVIGVVLNKGSAIQKYNPEEDYANKQNQLQQQQQNQQKYRARQDYSTPNVRTKKLNIQQENDVLTPILNKYSNSTNFSSYLNDQQKNQQKPGKNMPQLQKSKYDPKNSNSNLNQHSYKYGGVTNDTNNNQNSGNNTYSYYSQNNITSPLKRHSYLHSAGQQSQQINTNKNNGYNHQHYQQDIYKSSTPALFRSQLVHSNTGGEMGRNQPISYNNSYNYFNPHSQNNGNNYQKLNGIQNQMFMSLNNDRLLGNNFYNGNNNQNQHHHNGYVQSQQYLNTNPNSQMNSMHTISMQNSTNSGDNIYEDFQLVAIPKKYLQDNQNNIFKVDKVQKNDLVSQYLQGHQNGQQQQKAPQQQQQQQQKQTNFKINKGVNRSIKPQQQQSQQLKKNSNKKQQQQQQNDYLYQLDELESKHQEIINSLDTLASNKQKKLQQSQLRNK